MSQTNLSDSKVSEKSSKFGHSLEWTLRSTSEELLCSFFQRMWLTKERQFFNETCVSANLFERIIIMCRFFSESPRIAYKVTHLLDRFYKVHLERSRIEYDQLCNQYSDFESTNSWKDVLKRIRHQIPLRIVSCIFIVLKYELRANEPTSK